MAFSASITLNKVLQLDESREKHLSSDDSVTLLICASISSSAALHVARLLQSLFVLSHGQQYQERLLG